MRYDEFAFFNQQLAGMLKSGIPLEGALRQLSAGMERSKLRREIEQLEADLAGGTPLEGALAKRDLPEFYRHMIQVGVRSNDLAGVLILVADYYQKVSFIGIRLKGLMVYPAIVLFVSLGLSIFLTFYFRALQFDDFSMLLGMAGDNETWGRQGFPATVWAPMFFLILCSLGVLIIAVVPPVRRWLRWRLPGFREAGLSRLAQTLGLMLRGGTNLDQALGLVRSMEQSTPAGADIGRWRHLLGEGRGKLPELAASSRCLPPLFFWLVQTGGEDLAQGFATAAEIYYARAMHRVELLLYAALPVSIVFLGAVVISQAYPVIHAFVKFGSFLDHLGME